MMWIIFGFIMFILGLVLVIIHLLDKLIELQMYRNDNEVKKLIRTIDNSRCHDE